jgi:hypothetical protein
MTLAHLSILLGTSASLFAQELSRKEAQRIIESHQGFREANSFNLPQSLVPCGERERLWSIVGRWGLQIGPNGRSFLKEVRYNSATSNLMITTIGYHKRKLLAITGISDAQNGLKAADFDFAWEWVNVSPDLTKECLTMPADFGKARVLFKRYDDGWRMVAFNIAE